MLDARSSSTHLKYITVKEYNDNIERKFKALQINNKHPNHFLQQSKRNNAKFQT
jgi:hypothetical protein